MSSRDSKPSTNTNGTSSAEEQTRSAQELNEVEDLIPSTTESQAQDSEQISQAFSVVENMLHDMSRNLEEAKEEVMMLSRDFNSSVSTLKRKFDTMESEHQKTVEYVDSLKHDLVGKKSKSKEAEAPQHTTIINEPTMPQSSCSPTRMSFEGYQPLEHLGNFGNYVADESVIGGPSFEEFPSVGSATQRLPRSLRNKETVSEQTHVDPSAASQHFRRSDIRFYSQAIDPSGRFIAPPPPTPVKKQGYQTSRSATSFKAPGLKTVSANKLDPIVEKPEVYQKTVNEPIVEDPIIRRMGGEEGIVEQLTVEQPIAEKPLGEKQVVSEPIVKEGLVKEGLDEKELDEEELDEEELDEEEFDEEQDEEPLQEGPSSSSTIKKPKAEKAYYKFTKQECKRRREFNKDFNKKVELAQYYHERVMVDEKNDLCQTLMNYIEYMEDVRQNTKYKALSKKVGEKFMTERYNHYRKAGKEKMCILFMLLKENFHPCIAQDMYVLQQKLIASKQLDDYLDLEKEYYQFVSHEINTGAGPSEPSETLRDLNVMRHLNSKFHPIPDVPIQKKSEDSESDEETMDEAIDVYLDRELAVRQVPFDRFVNENAVSSLQLALIKQHQIFANSALKWGNEKAKEFFTQRAAYYSELGTTETRLQKKMFTLLSTKEDDDDILTTDAMVLSNALRNPDKFPNVELAYIRRFLQLHEDWIDSGCVLSEMN